MNIIKEFQPIHLKYCSDDTDCNCGKKGCDQRAFMNDKVALQVGDIEYFATEELLVEAGDGSYYGDFHDNTAFVNNWGQAGAGQAWTWNAAEYIQVILADGQESKVVHTSASFVFVECHIYRICFDITPDYGDDCDFEVSLRHPGTGALTQLKVYEGPTAGTYCFVYQPDDTVTRQLAFQVVGDCEGEGENTTYTLDNVSLKEIEPNVKIYNCCDESLVDTVEDCDITAGDDYFNIEFNWNDYLVEEGCHKICLVDVEHILNGTFDIDLSGWSQAGTASEESWQHGTGGFALDPLAYVDLEGGEVSKILSQGRQETFEIGLPANCTYPLTFDIIKENPAYTDWRLDLYVNQEIVQSYTTSGSKTYNIQLNTVFNSIAFKFTDLRAGGSPAISIGIDNVSINLDICSDCICVKDTHTCTHLIKAWNDSDTEDFAFPSLFAFYMRVESKFRNPRYPTQEEIYQSSHGVNTLNYRKSEKIWDFQMERIPEYMWDACTTIFGLDNLEIDGTKYIKLEGDIEPVWTKGNDYIASGTIEIKKKTENRVK